MFGFKNRNQANELQEEQSETENETEIDNSEVFDSIPKIIYQAFSNLKLTEWAICQAKYENEDIIKGIPHL